MSVGPRGRDLSEAATPRGWPTSALVGRSPLAPQTRDPLHGPARTLTYRPNSHAWLMGEVGSLPLYTGRSLPTLGPTDTSSSAWAIPHTVTYKPIFHAWFMGEVGSLPLYILRGGSPFTQHTHHPLHGQALAQRPTVPIPMRGLWGKWVFSPYI